MQRLAEIRLLGVDAHRVRGVEQSGDPDGRVHDEPERVLDRGAGPPLKHAVHGRSRHPQVPGEVRDAVGDGLRQKRLAIRLAAAEERPVDGKILLVDRTVARFMGIVELRARLGFGASRKHQQGTGNEERRNWSK